MLELGTVGSKHIQDGVNVVAWRNFQVDGSIKLGYHYGLNSRSQLVVLIDASLPHFNK